MGAGHFGGWTDTAGSGRVPAGFNKIVGLKPTPGIVSTSGVVPACRSLDCVSVFALTCEDGSRVMAVMRSFDAGDSYARRDTGEAVRYQKPAAHFRCGVPAAAQREFFGDAAARAAFEQSLDMLRKNGAELVDIDFQPFLDVARLLYQGPWVAERYAGIKSFLEQRPQEVHPVTRQVIESARQWNAVDTFEAMYALQAAQRRTPMVEPVITPEEREASRLIAERTHSWPPGTVRSKGCRLRRRSAPRRRRNTISSNRTSPISPA